jgi:hypothetical protein
MQRRQFFNALGGPTLALPLPAIAQQLYPVICLNLSDHGHLCASS